MEYRETTSDAIINEHIICMYELIDDIVEQLQLHTLNDAELVAAIAIMERVAKEVSLAIKDESHELDLEQTADLIMIKNNLLCLEFIARQQISDV